MTQGDDRSTNSKRRPEEWPCVCAFAKSVGERDPYKFPRVGLQHNVLRRGRLIIKHETTDVFAIQPLTKPCCPEWFRGA